MEEKKRRIFTQCVLLLVIACFVSRLHASSDRTFYDSFDDAFDGRWIVSEKEEYKGVWKHSKSEGHDDYGLLVSEPARKYAIVKELDEVVNLKDGTVVLQYEVRLQNGLECGGAYIKYLRPQDAKWLPKEFDNESPYSIMFGPDKCGPTNKVHFILKHNVRIVFLLEHCVIEHCVVLSCVSLSCGESWAAQSNFLLFFFLLFAYIYTLYAEQMGVECNREYIEYTIQ